MKSPVSYFSNLRDPRVERTREHDLEDILFIAIASVLCGAESWYDMEEFGKAKEEWLKTFLRLPGGIPSHDTFNRVFSALEPGELEKSFIAWTQAVAGLAEGEVVAIDGKSMRGTRERGNKSIVHMVSAWAQENCLTLGQIKVDEKSNEITAIPRLLDLLVLKGCIVTIDAMGCQKDIAAKIVDKEADYILALKGNQGNLLEQVEDSFRFLDPVLSDEQTDSGHGRVETRRCQVINDLSLIEQSARWKGLQCLVKVESVRYFKCSGKEETDTRLYITSLKPDAKLINSAVRFHWSIENSLHWVLDVAFNEDNSRKRSGFAAQNYSILNRIALNLLKNEKTTKVGVRGKRLKAGWDNQYLIKLLKN
ncbi:MAG: ISAs1 family transposase [Tannerellaceae bacterium]|jgi:predicted transposase YbfD/YdcC|nr:ISAs1 family transposase [Tannerellaceae bacterium]